MKYLKNYFLFLEDENLGTDGINPLPSDPEMDLKTKNTVSQSLLDSQSLLREFQDKKSKMENIFKDSKIKDDVSLDNALLNGVYNSKKDVNQRNRWLKELEVILKAERRKNALQIAIGSDEDQVKKTNDDINRLNSEISNASVSRKEQIISTLAMNNKRLKEIKDNIISNKKLLSQDTINWNKKSEDFKTSLKIEEERIKNLLSKV
jgi:predicted signal transduction protein with EAL and GGDEF domain